MFKILLADPEKRNLDSLKLLFQQEEEYEIISANDSQRAIEIAKLHRPHLILLEIALPGMDGIETCIELRKIESIKKTLIVFYTDREEDYSQISAFNAGADDYILKSIKSRLLVSRIKALFKRYDVNYSTPTNIAVNNEILRVDRERYLVIKEGNELFLPRKEFELLALLYSSPRKVFSRKELSDNVWGYDVFDKNRTIDVHIGKLRDKLGEHFIRTVKGKGYSLEI